MSPALDLRWGRATRPPRQRLKSVFLGKGRVLRGGWVQENQQVPPGEHGSDDSLLNFCFLRLYW